LSRATWRPEPADRETRRCHSHYESPVDDGQVHDEVRRDGRCILSLDVAMIGASSEPRSSPGRSVRSEHGPPMYESEVQAAIGGSSVLEL
jgi:hypothetical protein